jgi:hypothetical protein
MDCVLHEVLARVNMPVLGGYDELVLGSRRRNVGADGSGNGVTARRSHRATFGEVVLHVDDDERTTGAVLMLDSTDGVPSHFVRALS